MPIERLMAGQAFHKIVQSAFLTGLVGVSGFRERPWRLVRGGRGRAGLAAEVDGEEPMLVVIEIKGTGWDAIPADRVMRNLCRHLRQLQAYLDTAIEDMEAGQWEGIIGAMLYPARPSSAQTLAAIETVANDCCSGTLLARWPGWVRSRSERNGVLPPRTWLANERNWSGPASARRSSPRRLHLRCRSGIGGSVEAFVEPRSPVAGKSARKPSASSWVTYRSGAEASMRLCPRPVAGSPGTASPARSSTVSGGELRQVR